MAIEIKQQLRLSQQLVMTPQLQQAIKLLQPSEVQTEAEPPEPQVTQATEVAPEREPTDAEKVADLDWQNYMDAYPQTSFSERPEEDERRSLESTLTRRPLLSD